MPDLLRFPRLLAAAALSLPLLAGAQSTAPLTDAERARRDAEKVFSFIKFQTVPAKPAAEPAHKPARAAPAAAAPAPAAPAGNATAATAAPAPTRPPEAQAAAAAAPPVAKPTAALVAAEPPPTLEPAALTAPTPLAAPLGAAVLTPTPGPAAEAEPEADDADDGALQLQSFVAPVLSPALQSTLGAGSRSVKVRFTVEASGRVSHAEAAPQVPRRLAKPATDAILQWQFAPLPQARTVDVEIAFRRD